MDEIHRLLSSPNFYQAMGLNPKTVTSQDVQKRYKALAMKVHPDKNKDPRATTAFAKLCQMKDILSDDRKRREYNLTLNTKVPLRRTQSAPVFPTGSSTHAQHPSSKPKKSNNFAYQLATIFILFIIIFHISNVEPSSDSISKETLAKIIMFDEPHADHSLDYYYTTTHYKVIFYMPKEWVLSNIYGSRKETESRKIMDEIALKADDIYLDYLTQKCEMERKNSFSQPSCLRLQEMR